MKSIMTKVLLLGICLMLICTAVLAESGDREAILDAIRALNGGSVLLREDEDGDVTFLAGKLSEKKIEDEDAAQDLLIDLAPILSEEGLEFGVTDTLYSDDLTVYVFLQMDGSLIVDNSVIKMIVNAEKEPIGLVSSLTTIPAETYTEYITGEQAEQVVRETVGDKIKIYSDLTSGQLMTNEFDEDAQSTLLGVWVVYTNNTDIKSDRPYLAHYVEMDGKYLYSLPVFGPDTVESNTGYDHSEFFEGRTSAVCTQTVTYNNGDQETLEAPVMVDADGTMYLCDVERYIVMADYKDYQFNDGIITVLSNKDGSFPDKAFSVYSTMIRIYDLFSEYGWEGADGENTDILLLYGLCEEDGTPIENAYYSGAAQGGWQTFVFNEVEDDGRCFDVLAHEFTHCVTTSTMIYNPYYNDYGAINEAMSDIIGKIVELQLTSHDDPDWTIGLMGTQIRSMGNPHAFQQPEYTWDLYYQPNAWRPSDNNDNGGVHGNSSLLNMIAYKLCQGGMPLENAFNYWFDVACIISPMYEYPDLAAVLPWIMEISGQGDYQEILKAAIDDTRIADRSIPTSVPEGYGAVSFVVPDLAIFRTDSILAMLTDIHNTDFMVSSYPEDETYQVFIMAPEGEYICGVMSADLTTNQTSFFFVWTEDGWVDIQEIMSSGKGTLKITSGEIQELSTKNLDRIEYVQLFEELAQRVETEGVAGVLEQTSDEDLENVIGMMITLGVSADELQAVAEELEGEDGSEDGSDDDNMDELIQEILSVDPDELEKEAQTEEDMQFVQNVREFQQIMEVILQNPDDQSANEYGEELLGEIYYYLQQQ